MGLDDLDSEEFSELWESQDLDERVDELGKTATMKPTSQTRLVAESKREIVDELPTLEGVGGERTEPELRVEETIGEGGMARVLSAEQVPLGRDVAVKVLHRDRDQSAGELSLLQEAWVTGRMEHPNVVPVYRLGRDHEGGPAIVMKRIEGVPWIDVLEDPGRSPRAFDADDALGWHLDVLIEVCNAVHYAHSQGIIHRDLKPENVMVGAYGEVYLVDWGLAVSLDDDADDRLPKASDVVNAAGTPGYIAPEMIAGIGELLSRRTDVYLLGGLLHRIITGEPPHEGEEMMEVLQHAYTAESHEYDDDVPERLAEIAKKAMARDQEDRFESADAFRRALVDFERERQSYQLSQGARDRLDRLRDLLDGDATETPGDVQEMFGECRFGFEKALEVHDDNEDARTGLQEALELMIDYQIEREGYEAASLLLTDLPEPRPELEQRVDELGQRLESREEEYEELKDYRRESDVELGRNARSMLALLLGILWAGLGYAPVVARRVFDYEFGFGAYLAQGILVAVFLGGAFYLGRHALFRNEANKKILVSLVLVFGVEMLVRHACNVAEVPVGYTMSIEMMMSGMGAGVLAAGLDPRIGWAAVPYLVGGYVAMQAPGWVHEIIAVTNLVAMGALAAAWWRPASDGERAPAAADGV